MSTQLDRIEAMLIELVRENRQRRVDAEREAHNQSMIESEGMSVEQYKAASKSFQTKCLKILKGEQ